MLIGNWMTKDVVTIPIDETMTRAAALMKEKRIRTLPVMKKGKLIGILTDRDIKRASASDATTLEIHELLYLLGKQTVKSIMTANPITISPLHTMDEAALLMWERKISSLPVLDEKGELVGIVTMTDICRTLVSLTGLPHRGIQFGLRLSNRPGSIKEAADVIRAYGGRIASILSHDEKVLEDERTVYLRMYGVDRTDLNLLLADLRRNFKLLYMVDFKNNRRETFQDQAGQ